MTVVISQSMYFPWAGLLEQMRMADVFVHYDDVQYARGFLNRVQIKARDGSSPPAHPLWMTVPLSKSKRGQSINETKIDAHSDWRDRHRKMLKHAYARAPFFHEMFEVFDSVIAQDFDSLADLSRTSLVALAKYFGIARECRFERSENCDVPGSGSSRILDVVKTLGGTIYITGHGGRNYLDHNAFEAAGISVRYMQYKIGPYPQLHGEFTPYVSALDLIANCGKDGIRFLRSETVDWKETIS